MLFILGIVFIGAGVMAQSRTADSHVLSAKRTYYEYTGVTADTIGTLGCDTLIFEILANKNVPLSVNVRVEATKVGTTEQFGMELQGKIFENGTYVKIDSINSSTSVSVALNGYELNEQVISLSDTSGVATELSGTADNFYRYFRVIIGNDDDCTIADIFTIDAVIFKFYER